MLDNDRCNDCKDCNCADQPRNRIHNHNHHETRFRGETLQIGDVGCESHVPTMEFSGFGKAYVPCQKLCRIYQASTGFVRGTIFPELDLPYEGRGRNDH